VVFLEITIHDGARVPWHAHSGPGILVNTGPGTLTSVFGGDCVVREYGPGQAFVDHGGGTFHAAINDSGSDLVLYAVFLGVDNGPVLPADPPPGCDPFP
jgi:quercetin dioxygenase-like cupin family protein